ncbi:MAG TPA: hypothetical protein VFL86_03375, partial [Burkholderiaceae bacterium]|nr:hypothetical protein [Burkholderiaceae bacterium]
MLSVAACLPVARCAIAQPLQETHAMHSTDAHDFDFLFGRWRVFHSRLRERLAGNDDWQEFDGSLTAQPLLGGL